MLMIGQYLTVDTGGAHVLVRITDIPEYDDLIVTTRRNGDVLVINPFQILKEWTVTSDHDMVLS